MKQRGEHTHTHTHTHTYTQLYSPLIQAAELREHYKVKHLTNKQLINDFSTITTLGSYIF